jgi:hypothetical protein
VARLAGHGCSNTCGAALASHGPGSVVPARLDLRSDLGRSVAAQRSCSQHRDVDQLHAWRHREPHALLGVVAEMGRGGRRHIGGGKR